jgi:hypothetical protein
MAFFANSSNFKISGGKFNVIHGDLNQEDHTYTTFTSNSYNNYSDNNYADNNYADNNYADNNYADNNYADNSYPDDIPNHPYYDQYAPWPPRGRQPPRHRSQRRHQAHGAYGYAEYYDDRQSQSEGYYDGGYEPRGAPSRFENSLRSPASHIEIAGGEFMATRGRNATQHYHPDFQDGFAHEPEDLTPASSQAESVPESSDNAQENPDLDSSSDIPMSHEDGVALQNNATAIPASIPAHATKKPLTTVEKMRMAMADMEIDGIEAEAVNTPSAPTPSPKGKQKSSQSFTDKMFPFRQKSKP